MLTWSLSPMRRFDVKRKLSSSIVQKSGPRRPGASGNTVQAATKGVAAFTLLLSPDKFDFNQPIKVIANGHEVFNARVSRASEHF